MIWTTNWDGQAWAASWVGSWTISGPESRIVYLVPAEIRAVEIPTEDRSIEIEGL